MKLFIHAGHDKTGSSYIQSSIACSFIKLKEHDIFYPSNEKILTAKNGNISSGNLEIIYSNLDNHSQKANQCKSILISSEKLFRLIPDKDFLPFFNNFLDYYKISDISVLLFIRDPLDHLQSAYQQSVKRGGYTDSIEKFSLTYFHTKKVAQFVKHCIGENYNLKILNYSNSNNNIIKKFEDWLGLPNGFMTLPSTNLINRSLTFGELEFQRVANKFFGKNASVISNGLCRNLPDITSDKFGLNREHQRNVIDNIKPHCEYINSIIKLLNNESESYSLDFIHSPDTEIAYSFSREQITLLIEILSNIKISEIPSKNI